MANRRVLVLSAVTSGLIMIAGPVWAEQNPAVYSVAGSALDNTEINVRDRDSATLTPEDQQESASDIKITAAIRQAVVSDESLSVNAQNVKIITGNGKVTLRGPVATESESMVLQQIAKGTPGVVQVDNQLENIAP